MSAPTEPCVPDLSADAVPAAVTTALGDQEQGQGQGQTQGPGPIQGAAYAAQARGGADDYAAYYAGMDKSMQQKVALTTAFFPVRGRLADMGCGSGKGSYDLACLHSGLTVVGVDVAAESVAYAQASYRRANLEYRVGDIADPLFPTGSLDGALNSSVWHHLTSYNGFALREVRRCLVSQTAALRPGGVLIVRDFVVPRGPAEVLLDLPANDGASEGPVEGLSTAALFERFLAGFRSSQNPDGPVPCRRLADSGPGWRRYRLAHRAAAEFVLRKDYRSHWDAELREEYLFFSQPEYEEALRRHDLRVVLSVELRNPWIIDNRFRGRFFLWDLDGKRLPYPPTNYLIVGEKVAPGRGVHFSLRRAPTQPPHFLSRSLFTDRETGQRIELVARPNPVVDLIPFFRAEGTLFVLAKQGFPRPLVNAAPGDQNLDGATVAGYLTEPISAQRPASEGGELSATAAAEVLAERAGLLPSSVHAVRPGLRYFTSPGGLNERVTASLIELGLDGAGALPLPEEAPNYSSFSSAGRVRPLAAQQLLRAAQVGGLLDARLELNTHHLLRALGDPLGPWIGAEIVLSDQPTRPGLLGADEVEAVLTPPPRQRFAPRASEDEPELAAGFLEVWRAEITEHDSAGRALCSAELEVVTPLPVSCSTASVLPVVRAGGAAYVGLELRDLPAAQALAGSSGLVTCPAWRLPHAVKNLEQAEAHVLRALFEQFGVQARRAWPLGGKYYPAAGATPEVVYPLAAEVDVESVPGSGLRWVPLAALVERRGLLRDGHLLIALLRLAHALENPA